MTEGTLLVEMEASLSAHFCTVDVDWLRQHPTFGSHPPAWRAVPLTHVNNIARYKLLFFWSFEIGIPIIAIILPRI